MRDLLPFFFFYAGLLFSCPAEAEGGRFSAYPPAEVEVSEPTRFSCRTACGVSISGLSPTECVELSLYEAKVLESFERYTHWKKASACQALSGWTLRVHTEGLDKRGSWFVPVFGWVYGVTNLRTRTVAVATKDWPVSALAHELAHVVGQALDGWTPGAPGHVEWCANGVGHALNAVSFLKECRKPR